MTDNAQPTPAQEIERLQAQLTKTGLELASVTRALRAQVKASEKHLAQVGGLQVQVADLELANEAGAKQVEELRAALNQARADLEAARKPKPKAPAAASKRTK